MRADCTRMLLVPACTLALALGIAASFLPVDAPFLGCQRGPGFPPDLWLNERLSDHCFKASERRAPILLLAALGARSDQDAAIVNEFLPREPAQALPDLRRQALVLP